MVKIDDGPIGPHFAPPLENPLIEMQRSIAHSMTGHVSRTGSPFFFYLFPPLFLFTFMSFACCTSSLFHFLFLLFGRTATAMSVSRQRWPLLEMNFLFFFKLKCAAHQTSRIVVDVAVITSAGVVIITQLKSCERVN